jgi:hypothetical protein
MANQIVWCDIPVLDLERAIRVMFVKSSTCAADEPGKK